MRKEGLKYNIGVLVEGMLKAQKGHEEATQLLTASQAVAATMKAHAKAMEVKVHHMEEVEARAPKVESNLVAIQETLMQHMKATKTKFAKEKIYLTIIHDPLTHYVEVVEGKAEKVEVELAACQETPSQHVEATKSKVVVVDGALQTKAA